MIYHKGEENTESVICKLYEHLPITWLFINFSYESHSIRTINSWGKVTFGLNLKENYSACDMKEKRVTGFQKEVNKLFRFFVLLQNISNFISLMKSAFFILWLLNIYFFLSTLFLKSEWSYNISNILSTSLSFQMSKSFKLSFFDWSYRIKNISQTPIFHMKNPGPN